MMQTAKYVYWQVDDAWLGYLQEFPDYWTQWETLDDLIEHLKDLYLDMTSDQISGEDCKVDPMWLTNGR